MFGNPLVSVILPVYNGERFLAEALESIRQQNYSPLEIIIIDDGSTDRTPQIINELGGDVRVVRQANSGPAAARNRGLEIAIGDFIAFLDADDLWPQGKLKLQVNYLLSHPEHDLVTGRIQVIELAGASRFVEFEGPDKTLSHINLGAAVCRKRLLDHIGYFDEALHISEDQDWFLRVREQKIPIIVLEEITLLYRLHTGNMTRNAGLADFLLPRVFKMSLDRRRKQNHGTVPDLENWLQFDQKRRAEVHRGPGGATSAGRCEPGAPQVSVIIPVFNCARYLGEAIGSVLSQTYPPAQVVVVDDGSSDGSADVARGFAPRVEYVRQAHTGVAAARNHGVRRARAELLAFLDADDRWLPDKLLRQITALNQDTGCKMVLGFVRQFLSPEIETQRPFLSAPLAGYVAGTLLVRKEAFLRVGFFNENWRSGEFIDWYSRAVDQGMSGYLLKEVVLERRIHDCNHGVLRRDERIDYARVLKAALDRRRQARQKAMTEAAS